ncbi:MULTISPECIES: hypothetical protein [Dethiosulfovibrio]|uniref:Uncharacterized protein n=2 Tax=Dethiosulfovibrio TaxID=47054 RepID=A0ABS9ENC4_9BACT|nr:MULTISPECIES: hypothetical protein [Dethiosulfovibrio]MCF4113910.1 hypothetical protein [Dethiosulfovibrio russensis]MCF4141677.1 hypothetical protein [Dethiosulfovibrio marinus]MCF4143906.1 hypothetical protein [Dethiosulfovibrio acidaminovorans]
MMAKSRKVCAVLAAGWIALGLWTTPASAIDLGDVLKDVAGVAVGGFVIDKVAGPINDFINTVTFNKGAKVEGHTKVVPIVSLGSGTRIGAAQVAGPKKDGVVRVKAVASLETSFRDRFRIKILVPVDSVNPLQRFVRVQGVGVSAVIDYKL